MTAISHKVSSTYHRRLHHIALVLLSMTLLLVVGAPAHAQQQTSDAAGEGSEMLFLPQISNSVDVSILADIDIAASAVADHSLASCNNTAEETAVATFFLNDARQARTTVVCNPLLADVARQRAADMAQRAYFDHVNPDGAGPNSLIRSAGYRLPDYYDTSGIGNNVESIAAGFADAQTAWEGWVNSDHHRSHVLAEEPFFAEQTEYGVGYYYDPNSYYHHYWVLLTALPDSQ